MPTSGGRRSGGTLPDHRRWLIPVVPLPVLADVGEFGLIERLLRRFSPGPGVLLGPGDDAAVIRAPDGRVVATTDLLVDGIHFDRSYSSGYDVGRRAAAANLADIAAMGALPTALLVGLAAPGQLPVAWAEQLADGLAEESAGAGCSVVGGDVVASDRLTIAVTALGDLTGREPVTRAGARPGDVVVVAGRLGWAAAGLALLEAGLGPAQAGTVSEPGASPPEPGGTPSEPGDQEALAVLAAAHRRPEVPYAAARCLAEAGATAMLDVSDGLAGDAAHLARASGVRLDLEVAALPVDPALEVAARRLGAPALSWVVGGGDDHAFLAALPADRLAGAVAAAARLPAPCRVTRIGVVAAGSGVNWLGGQPPGTAHEHFREPL